VLYNKGEGVPQDDMGKLYIGFAKPQSKEKQQHKTTLVEPMNTAKCATRLRAGGTLVSQSSRAG